MKKTFRRRSLKSFAGLAIAMLVLAPTSALAKTNVVGGPLTNLDPAGSKIHLSLSNFPAAPTNVGLYILQCLNSVTAGKTSDFCNTTTQLWISTNPRASFAPTGDIVLSVTGAVAGTECGTDKCSIFLTYDHTNSVNRDEDQFIPISFKAGATTPTKPKDLITASIDGKDLSTSSPGTLAYRTPVKISANAKSGGAVTFGSSTPDCTVANGLITALKGAGACNITVSAPESTEYQATTAHYPFYLSKGVQKIASPKAVLKSGKPVKLAPVSNFGETFKYSTTTPKVCTIKGATLKPIKKGACSISATAAGQTGLWDEVKIEKMVKIK